MQSQTEDLKQSTKAKQHPHEKMLIIDEPSTITYTTRIVKVPNKTRYAPSRNQVIHDTPPKTVPIKIIPTLTAEIGATFETDDETTCAGVSQSADELVKSSILSPVKTRLISSSVFHNWVTNNQSNWRAKNWQNHRVLVLKGKWDHAERILQAAGIPCLSVSADKFVHNLPDAKVVVINCPGEMSDSALQNLQNFVNNGGYLLTTDWSLSNCLTPLFHQFVTWDGSYSTAEIVDSVAVDASNELFKNAVSSAPWKLDDKSEIAKLVNRNRVEVLVRSRMLSKEDQNNLGILALTFAYGKGRVLHLVGHFDNNTVSRLPAALPDPAPKIELSLRQALALNFVLAGLSRSIIHETRN